MSISFWLRAHEQTIKGNLFLCKPNKLKKVTKNRYRTHSNTMLCIWIHSMDKRCTSYFSKTPKVIDKNLLDVGSCREKYLHLKVTCSAKAPDWTVELKWHSPVFDEGLEVEGEAHAERQQRRIFLQHFGQNLKVCLTVLVGKLSCGQLHLEDIKPQTVYQFFTLLFIL